MVLEKAINENLSLTQIKELIEQLDNQKLTKEKEVAPHKVLSQRCIDIGKRLSKETKLSSDARKRKKVEKLLNDLEKLLEDSQTGAVQDNSLISISVTGKTNMAFAGLSSQEYIASISIGDLSESYT
jgi:hypothetical protein